MKVDRSLPPRQGLILSVTSVTSVTTRMNIGLSGDFTVTSNGYMRVTVTFGCAVGALRASHSFPPAPCEELKVTGYKPNEYWVFWWFYCYIPRLHDGYGYDQGFRERRGISVCFLDTARHS